MKILIVTAVWGEWHTGVFVENALPSLLHESNLPALARSCECMWMIRTKRELIDEITRRTADIPLLQVEVKTQQDQDAMNYKQIWKEAHELAQRMGALCMFLPPDVIWSVGSFEHIVKLLEQGKRTIFVSHPRATPARFNGSAKSAEELMLNVIADNHPLNKASDFKSERFTHHPEMVIFPIKGAHVVRLMGREAFICDPKEVAFNQVNLPTAIGTGPHVVGSSDECFGVSIARESHGKDDYRDEQQCIVKNVANWMREYDSPTNKWLSLQPIVWRYGKVDDDELQRMIHDSETFVKEVHQSQ